MMILDWLDQLEREGTTGIWTSDKTVAVSRNHLRALIEVARAAQGLWVRRAVMTGAPADPEVARVVDALAPLLAEEDGER